MTEILLKVALNTITQPEHINKTKCHLKLIDLFGSLYKNKEPNKRTQILC